MTTHPNPLYVSPETYLLGEEDSPMKHEYINGEIYAMAGATDAHVTISLNLASMLRNHVRGTNCRAYMSDMKVRIKESNIFYYPDILVTCDSRDLALPKFKYYPCLVVEVLSPSTGAFDRGHKFAHYRNVETLQEYLLINQESVAVECYRLNPAKRWELYPYSLGDEVHLDSLDFRCQIADIYEDVL